MEDAFCSQNRGQLGNMIGSASYRPIQIFMDMDLPWQAQIYASQDCPSGLNDLLRTFQNHLKTPILCYATRPQNKADPSKRTVYILSQIDKTLSYECVSYRIPRLNFLSILEKVLNNVLLNSNDQLAEPYMVKSPKRILAICTHAQRDRCCGTFGKQLYDSVIASKEWKHPDLEVVECSHIGGHRYAPTLIEIPSMRVWGGLDLDLVKKIIEQDEDAPLDHYRGSCALSKPYEQYADFLAFKKFSWQWPLRDTFVESSTELLDGQETIFVTLKNTRKHNVILQAQLLHEKSLELKVSCFKDKTSLHPIYKVLKTQFQAEEPF